MFRKSAQLPQPGLTLRRDYSKIERSGPVAQLGARFHGMEEVIGSIPIRSTNYFNHLAPPPFRDFVASLSQTPKPLHGQASFPAYRRARNQPLSSFALAVEQVVVLRREVLPASPTAFAAPAR